jgi:hypothetical protein
MPTRPPPFRPSFTLTLLYVAGFFFFYAMLFALPDLIGELRQLEPSSGPLTPEELERARQVSRQALSGGKVLVALLAALATAGIGIWRHALPGVR